MSLIPRYQIRRGTADEWNAANPILLAGEMGLETDTRKLKVGNGVARWADLPYIHFDTTITWSTPPTSSTSPGFPGDVAYSDDFFYIRTASGWRQVALQAVSSEIIITQQPSDASVLDGDTATFSVVASSQEAISYQWLSSSDGVSFVAISGATESSLSVAGDLASSGQQYRATLSAPGASSVTTAVATLTVVETFRLTTESGSDILTEDGSNLSHDGLSIQFFVTITQQPSDATASSGSASFSVAAISSGGLALTYQWQKSIDGVTFTSIAGATSPTLSLSGLVFANDNGQQYRVIVDAIASDPVTSAAATLTVEQPTLSFSQQPSSTTASNGIATFSATAINSDGSSVTYQWQRSIDGVNFVDVAGKTSPSISLSGLTFADDDGDKYRVIASSPTADPAVSDEASLTVQQPTLSFAQQPSGATASGGAASFSALAASSDDSTVSYQWQKSSDGVTFENISGANSFSLVLAGLTNAADDGDRYRVVASSLTTSPITSDTVTLTVPQTVISFTTLPVNVTSSNGSATFSAAAVSSDGSNVTYQWQKSDDGVTFSDIPGATGTTLSLAGLTYAADNGDKYRVVADSPTTNPETSVAGTLTVPQPSITFSLHPSSVTASGGDATFTAAASASDGSTVTYQWQRSYEDSAYQNIDGETSTVLSLTDLTRAADDGAEYRVVADSPTAPAVASNAATLTVPSASFEFTQEPSDTTATAGGEATFTASATSSDGSPVAYQWQKSDDGVTFTDIDGATSSTLSLTGLTIADDDGDRYRVVAGEQGDNQSISNYATLFAPAIALEFSQQPQDTNASGGSATFTAVASETSYGMVVSYQWQSGSFGVWNDMPGETGSSLTLSNLTSSSHNTIYRVVATVSDTVGEATLPSDGAKLVVPFLSITRQPEDASAVVPTEWSQAGQDLSGTVYSLAGYSVAMSEDGTRIIFGLKGGYNSENVRTGLVRVFDWDGSSWEKVGEDIYGTTNQESAGWSVAISGDGSRIAFGSPLNSDGGTYAGRVTVYEWTGFTWEPLGSTIDGQASYGRLGSSIAMSDDGNTIAIGTPYDSHNGANAGKVQVFSWTGSYWGEPGGDIYGEAAGETAGYSVALSADGGRVAVGAPNAIASPYGTSINPAKKGAVRVYDLVGANWLPVGVTIGGSVVGQKSGSAVALSADGTRLAIGDPNAFQGGQSSTGKVRVYDWTGSTWSQAGLDVHGSLSVSGNFGASVSFSSDGSRLAVGSPLDDGGNGRVFLLTSGVWVQIGDSVGDAVADERIGFSTVLSGDGNRIAVGGPYSDSGAMDSGLLRVYDLSDATPATFSVGVFSSDGAEVLYQWQKSDDNGVTFVDVAGATASTLTIQNATASADNGDQYRVVVDSLTSSPVTSFAATLTVPAPELEIFLHPQDTTATNGDAEFTVVGADTAYYSTVTYQWQVFDGASWIDLAGEVGPALSLSGLTSASDGNQYRVVLDSAGSSGSSSLTSNAATLTVPFISITTQPQNVTAAQNGWSQLGSDINGTLLNSGSNSGVGAALALSNNGNRVAVGEALYGSDGRVRVFYWTGSSWTQLGPDITDANRYRFGQRVAISEDGTRLCISGATGFFSGSTTVSSYSLTGTSGNLAWTQDLSDLVAQGNIISLSDDGTRLAVGDPEYGNAGFGGYGIVRVFSRGSTAWTQLGSGIQGQTTGELWGNAVAISGDGTRVAVGAPASDAGNYITTPDIGQVHVFEWSGSAWGQVGSSLQGLGYSTSLGGYNSSTGQNFGSSLALSEDGDRLIVGAPNHSEGDNFSGEVTVFDWNGTSWGIAGSSINGSQYGEKLGSSVAISSDGNRIAVKAGKKIGGTLRGSVRVFGWNGSAWDQLSVDIVQSGVDLGTDVDIAGNGSIVGIGGDSSTGLVRMVRPKFSASFTFQASTNDGSAITIQWQKADNGGSFADIAGATSGSLSLDELTASADNGDQYRVVLDSPTTDPVTSNSATLTVT